MLVCRTKLIFSSSALGTLQAVCFSLLRRAFAPECKAIFTSTLFSPVQRLALDAYGVIQNVSFPHFSQKIRLLGKVLSKCEHIIISLSQFAKHIFSQKEWCVCVYSQRVLQLWRCQLFYGPFVDWRGDRVCITSGMVIIGERCWPNDIVFLLVIWRGY